MPADPSTSQSAKQHRVRLVPCGPYANESERIAAQRVKAAAMSLQGQSDWVFLTNHSSSSGNSHLSDEIDLIVIGPSGVRVVEVKHWSGSTLGTHEGTAFHEAEKLNAKVKRLSGKLRKICPEVGFVDGAFLLTAKKKETFSGSDGQRCHVHGIPVYGLGDAAEILRPHGAVILSSRSIQAVAAALEPLSSGSLATDLKAFDRFVELVKISDPEDRFCRVFKARREPGQERVFLHLYDLSASDEKNPRKIAEREFLALQRLQKLRALPSLMDSFQEAVHYPGELFFFSYLDSGASTLADRAGDATWSPTSRLVVSCAILQALHEVHEASPGDESVVIHRNLTPHTIRVDSKGRPVFIGLSAMRLPGLTTFTTELAPDNPDRIFVAPEVLKNGFAASTHSSDTFSICRVLATLFDPSDGLSSKVLSILKRGLNESAIKRPSLPELSSDLAQLTNDGSLNVANNAQVDHERRVPPLEFWDDTTVVELHGRHYQIVTELGKGGIGVAFKVMEVSEDGEELSGPYVAKVITNHSVGKDATQAYARIRHQTGAPGLAGVLEVASTWEVGRIAVLLKWVEGLPLSNFSGVLQLLFEESRGSFSEAILLEWIRQPLLALDSLHQAGLVHGDVSPRNLILEGLNVVLIDYDCAGQSGQKPRGGTSAYCSPNVENRTSVSPVDDVFALAASLFECVFDKKPFSHPKGFDRTSLNWTGVDRDEWPLFARFLDLAIANEFKNAAEALQYLSQALQPSNEALELKPKSLELAPRVIERLALILQGYPGSPRGNVETRGLDSDFARSTYVDTGLDETIRTLIAKGDLSVVVLCGNAGDGKTAFLQHLRESLGLPPGRSSDRVWTETLDSGVQIKVNLDGSAALGDVSAEELLNEFFAPFATHDFPANLVHLVAINDGPLLHWLTSQSNSTYIREQLLSALEGAHAGLDPRIRFIDLNNRSLVGGLSEGGLSFSFLDELLSRLIGDSDTWSLCDSCTARKRCHANRSVKNLLNPELGPTIRSQLAHVLLAVHQRGEVHITARELRATLTYIFFGTEYCQDLHDNPDTIPMAYFERAFRTDSPLRQGILLGELAQLDPGVESNAKLDRFLMAELRRAPGTSLPLPPSESKKALMSMRRRAYFEWNDSKRTEVGGSARLRGGASLEKFMLVATGTPTEVEAICQELVDGITCLEDLPHAAYADPIHAPFRITPRTPTETAFWVLKPRARFSLVALTPRAQLGIEVLHTHVQLNYAYASGTFESLKLGAELFHLLLRLKDGYQLSDSRSDDVFSHLAVFKQRLAQEDDSTLHAWNPMGTGAYKLATVKNAGGNQKLRISGVQ